MENTISGYNYWREDLHAWMFVGKVNLYNNNFDGFYA